MKKFLAILVLGLLIFSSNFADAKSSELINTIMEKNENFNLGIKKGDTTINGLKFRIHTKKEPYLNAVKNNYGWIDYGYQIVYADDGAPVRWGDTAQRFELHIDDCGFLYKNGKNRDCLRDPKRHRFEVGQGNNKKTSLGYSHKQEYWYTVSVYFPKDFKMTREQLTFFQFHSNQGEFPPILLFMLDTYSKGGLAIDIATSKGSSPGNCEGVKADKGKRKQCNVYLKHTLLSLSEAEALAGTWIDFVIHVKWDKRASDHKKNEGLFKVWMNGQQQIDYKGQTLWRKGKAVMQYGIYERVGVKKNSDLTLNDLRSIPSIVYHDEIWAKKECEQLDLERLGYSCSELKKQTHSITPRSEGTITKPKGGIIQIEGKYQLKWYWVNENTKTNNITKNMFVVFDMISFQKGIATFDKFGSSRMISNKYREKIEFYQGEGEEIIITGNLDLDSQQDTEPVTILLKPDLDNKGTYVGMGLWSHNEEKSKKEYIKAILVPIN